MDPLYKTLTTGLKEQTFLLEEFQHRLDILPKGSLYTKNTKNGKSYYQVTHKTVNNKRITKHKKLRSNDKTIIQLSEKKAIRKIISICKTNVHVLATAQKHYKPIDTELKNITLEKFQSEIITNQVHEQCQTDPRYHRHATACGILVRSKSEALLLNALWHYGIPFLYEEKFPWRDARGKSFYPDITILLPNGENIIWEHFGMLDNLDYCEDNVYRLNCYHVHGYSIGKNLIITSDDNKGNCSSDLFYHIIETYILPYFQ